VQSNIRQSSGYNDDEKKATAVSLDSPAKQLAGFMAKFDARVGKLIRSTRLAVRRRFPTATEIVSDKYNFLALGFSSSERPSDCVVSLAANTKGVGLCLYYGATLPDPHEILQGSGNQTRFIRLESAATLANPAVEALLKAALKQAKSPMPTAGKGRSIIRSISAKQRPRRSS
jgi:Domain of unknown function (DU1801)